jgi:hypothetical protein
VVNGQRPKQKLVKAGAVVLLVAVLALGLFLQQLNSHPWLRLFGAVIDAAFAVVGTQLLAHGSAVLERADDFAARTHDFLSTHRKWSLMAAVVVVVVSVPVAAVMVWPTPLRLVASGCPEPMELRVLTSTDGQGWVSDLLDRYTRSTAANAGTGSGRCPTVHPTVYAAPVPQVTTALAASWATNGSQQPLRDIGPRPDIWLPDSQLDVVDVTTLAARSGYPPPLPDVPGAGSSIGFSPIVVAGRNPSSRAAVSALASSQALASVFVPGTGVLAADPQASTTGLLAMVDYLRDGAGTVTAAVARRRVQAVTSSAGVAGADSVTALCLAGSPNSTATAVITSDQLWQLYSADDGLGTCSDGRPDFANWSKAAAPADAPGLNHPMVEPSWTWGNGTMRDRVEDLRDWLETSEGREALNHVHLQPPTGCQATPPPFAGCGPADLKQFRTLYDAARRPGRVLMVMDVSGSMGKPVTTGRTRFDVASAGLAQALGLLGSQDQFGLWTFPGPDREAHQPIVARIKAITAPQRNAAVARLAAVTPHGETPLYRTIVDGVRAVAGTGAAGRKTALVVLTDGQDTISDVSRDRTRSAIVAATGTEVYIVAIGEAACGGPRGLRALTAGHGDCYDTGYDDISNTMARLFEGLWKG